MAYLSSHLELYGVHLYSHKENWPVIISSLPAIIEADSYFLFLDAERGYHLKIFARKEFGPLTLRLKQLLYSMPLYEYHLQDTLFYNIPPNSVIPVNFISENNDFKVEDTGQAHRVFALLNAITRVFTATCINRGFYLDEEKRINFAFQLIFLALSRQNKEQQTKQLEGLSNQPLPDVDLHLTNFFQDIAGMESTGEKLESWVSDWLGASETFLSFEKLSLLIECITQSLEIRGFSEKLLLTSYTVLRKHRGK